MTWTEEDYKTILRHLEIREACKPEDQGKHALIVNGEVVDIADTYEAIITLGYANYGLGTWMCTHLEPLHPHEIRWRSDHLAAEAEYASWIALLQEEAQVRWFLPDPPIVHTPTHMEWDWEAP